jgi:hypothetical protein
MDIVWSFLVGILVGAFFSRFGWGWEYLGRPVEWLLDKLGW